MSNISIVYFRNESTSDEIELEKFWLEIKEDFYKAEDDNSNIRIESRRMHQSAFAGEYAGIFIEIVINGIPLIDATLNIWEKIVKHLDTKRLQGKTIRINNLTSLENICKVDLISQKNVKNAEIFDSKILTPNYVEDQQKEREFIYEGSVKIENAARITFENKKEKFTYIIQTDGNIVDFQRRKKKESNN